MTRASASASGRVAVAKAERRDGARVVRREEREGRKHVFIAGRVAVKLSPKELRR